MPLTKRSNPNPFISVEPPPKTRQWQSRVTRTKSYKAKIDAIKNGTAGDDFFFFAGEMVNYLLDRQDISEEAFNEKLGFSQQYFSRDIMHNGCNDGTYMLPEPFRKRMAVLTRASLEKAGKNPDEFWCKRNFTLADIEGIYIDMTQELGDAKVQYPKSEPSRTTQEALNKIPELATTLLIDPRTKQWRRDTFLIDAEGQFRPVQSMPSIRYVVEHPHHTPEEIIGALTTRNADDGYFRDKGQFMRQVLKTAKEQHLISGMDRAISYIPLRPENSSAWSR